jgi:hypothetical protein
LQINGRRSHSRPHLCILKKSRCIVATPKGKMLYFYRFQALHTCPLVVKIHCPLFLPQFCVHLYFIRNFYILLNLFWSIICTKYLPLDVKQQTINQSTGYSIASFWLIIYIFPRLIDWLIDYCLTSSELYFSYIQDENEFNNI